MRQLSYLIAALKPLGARKVILLTAAMFLNNLLEGIGLATLVPLFALLLGEKGQELPPLAQHMLAIFERAGLPADVWLLALLAAAFLILRQIFAFLIQVWAGFIITDMSLHLRRKMLSSVLRVRWPWFHDQQLGSLALSIVQFTNGASSAMEQAVLFLAQLLRTLVYVGLVILISPLLALVIVIAAIVLYGPLLILVQLMRKYSGKFATSAQQLSASFSDIFGSIKMIRTMGLQDNIRPLLEKLICRLRRYRRRTILASQGLMALQNILAIVFMFSVLALAVNVLAISLVEVGMVAGLAMSIVKNLAKAQTRLQKVAECIPYLDRVQAIMTSAKRAREISHGQRPPQLLHGIQLKNVHFSYPGGKKVLDGVSMTLPARKISVLRGPSGAGKTTITDLITGLVEPDAGEVRIDDVPLDDIDLAAWRRMIGYVPQELILLSGTVRDNLAMGEEIADDDIWRALELAGAKDFVKALPNGLDSDLGERGVKLSGGQRQRLSLARALVRKPQLLILDEVTSALDPHTERQLVRSIGELARREGLTVIAITHTQAWQVVADVVHHLENGTITSVCGDNRQHC